MRAYKLCRLLKTGEITSLFINKTFRIPFGEWLDAEPHETKGYKFRPFWHCMEKPQAPHLTEKKRVWVEVEMKDYEELNRPESQGGKWYLAKQVKFIKKVDEENKNTNL